MERYCKINYEEVPYSTEIEERKFVLCYDDTELVKKIDVTDLSHYFIRDIIENWCEGILQ
jgi:hypothetical protein